MINMFKKKDKSKEPIKKESIDRKIPVTIGEGVVQTHFIPQWELANNQAAIIRNACIQRITAIASHKYLDVVGRSLLASDLGLSQWKTSALIKETPTQWVSIATDKLTYIVIYGITQLSKTPTVSIMSFEVADAIRIKTEIDCLYTLLPLLQKMESLEEVDKLKEQYDNLEKLSMTGYFQAALLCLPMTHLRIMVTSFEDNPEGDRLMLRGHVIEARGLTISP